MLKILASLVEETPPPAAPGDYGFMFFKMLGSLVLLVALLGLTAWALKRIIRQRMQRGNRGQSINILEKRMLSPKTMLYLVEVEHRKVLLAESHLEVRPLHVVTEESPLPPSE